MPSNAPQSVPPPSVPPPDHPVERLTLLVVDDEEGPRESLKMIFGREFEVLPACSGEEGVALARERRVAVAIVDIRMQEMNGIEVLRQLKAIHEDTQVVILTAYETLQTAREAVRNGASDYLSKPFDLDHIQQVVRKCAQRYETAESLTTRAEEDIQRAKNDFLAILSHELNTPMNGIIGLQELLAQTELTREQQEMLEDIEDCSYDLFGKINDILQYARLATDSYAMSGEVFNPVGLLMKLPDAPDRKYGGVHIHYRVRDPVPESVYGPEYEIHIILLKLLDNACKFTRSGDVVVHLRSEPRSGGRHLLVYSVRDSGIGIPEEYLQGGQLLQPFTQGDPSNTRSYDGLGMGLALCHRLTEQIGGSLHIQNNEDRGSTVTFSVEVGPDPSRVKGA